MHRPLPLLALSCAALLAGLGLGLPGCAAPERSRALPREPEARRGVGPGEETALGYALAHLQSRGVDPRTVHVACAAPRTGWLRRGPAYPELAAWVVGVSVGGRGADGAPEEHTLWLRAEELLASEGPGPRGRPLRTYYPAYDRVVAAVAAGETDAAPAPAAAPDAARAPVAEDRLPGADTLLAPPGPSADPLDGVAQGMSLAGVRAVLGPPLSDVSVVDGSRRLTYVFEDERGARRVVTLIFRDGALFATPGGVLRPAGRAEPAPAPPTTAERAVARLRVGLELDAVQDLLGEPLRDRVGEDGRREVTFQFSATGSRAGSTQFVTAVFEGDRLVAVPGYPLAE